MSAISVDILLKLAGVASSCAHSSDNAIISDDTLDASKVFGCREYFLLLGDFDLQEFRIWVCIRPE